MISIENISKIKQNRFEKFIKSPYFNNNHRIELLFKLIIKERLDDQELHDRIYPEYPFKRQRLYDLHSELNSLFQKFLAIENMDEEKKWDMEILHGLNNSNMEKQFRLKFKTISKRTERTSLKNEMFYFNRFQLAELNDEFITRAEKKSSDQSLQEKADYLDIHYLIVKQKTICEMLNRQRIIQSNFELRALDEVQSIIENDKDYYFQFPPVHFYFYLIKLYQTGSFKVYEKLVGLLAEYFDFFKLSEIKEFYEYIQNHCIRQINKGEQAYLHHLYALFQERLDNKLFDKLGNITEWTYKTAITVGLRLQKYDWVFELINNLKQLLSDDIRDNAYNYNLANMYFEMNEFRRALRILNTVEFTDDFYNLDARVLILKIYFENEEQEPLSAHIQAFKAFLRRNRTLSDHQKLIYSNLLKYTLKLIRLSERRPRKATDNFKKKIEELKLDIAGVGLLANKQWLLSKLEAMSK
ncbi:MAG: hypothetical protein MRY83_00445 [Flavobacteriales bacterium]|nr:hypothetical protein [Flavobacteriales bacterium]